MTTYLIYVCENIKTSMKKSDGSFLDLECIKEGTKTTYLVTCWKTDDQKRDVWHWEKSFSSLDLAQAEYDRFA